MLFHNWGGGGDIFLQLELHHSSGEPITDLRLRVHRPYGYIAPNEWVIVTYLQLKVPELSILLLQIMAGEHHIHNVAEFISACRKLGVPEDKVRHSNLLRRSIEEHVVLNYVVYISLLSSFFFIPERAVYALW